VVHIPSAGASALHAAPNGSWAIGWWVMRKSRYFHSHDTDPCAPPTGEYRPLANATHAAPSDGRMRLRLSVAHGTQFSAFFRGGRSGEKAEWRQLGPTVDGKDLPTWDLGLRAAMVVGGGAAPVGFRFFALQAHDNGAAEAARTAVQ
jgi:hypothetical protein